MAEDWRYRLETLNFTAFKDNELLYQRYITPAPEETGICGPTGAGMYIRNDGVIDIYAKEGLGISIDPNLDSVSIFAKKINLNGSEIDLYSDLNKMRWNKFPLNLKYQILGQAGPFPAVSEGTILPIPQLPQAIADYVKSVIGGLGG